MKLLRNVIIACTVLVSITFVAHTAAKKIKQADDLRKARVELCKRERLKVEKAKGINTQAKHAVFAWNPKTCEEIYK